MTTNSNNTTTNLNDDIIVGSGDDIFGEALPGGGAPLPEDALDGLTPIDPILVEPQDEPVEDQFIVGTGSDDTLIGGAGDDEINAGGGNDSIDGGAGDDFLRGQNGNDIIEGGAGADTIEGGNGRDTASYVQSAAAVDIDLERGNAA